MNLHETVVRRWLKQVQLQKTGQGNCCKTPRQCCVFFGKRTSAQHIVASDFNDGLGLVES